MQQPVVGGQPRPSTREGFQEPFAVAGRPTPTTGNQAERPQIRIRVAGVLVAQSDPKPYALSRPLDGRNLPRRDLAVEVQR